MRIFANGRQVAVFFLFCVVLFTAGLVNEYFKWRKFSAQNYQTLEATVAGISFKHDKSGMPFETLYVYSSEGRFCFWQDSENRHLLFHKVSVALSSSQISFANWLGGKCANAYGLKDLGEDDSFMPNKVLYEKIKSEHKNDLVAQLYLSLYLNAPVDEFLQNKISDYGLSAVLALSGLNVMLLWGFAWLVLSPLYGYFQNRYFPWRSKSLDIGMFILLCLFFYLYITGFAPSFARALFMAGVAFLLSERGFKIFSFESLAVAICALLALFPAFIVSLGFWLSVIAVWFIFIFERNFKASKVVIFAVFPIWIWIAMMPIIHFLFYSFSASQFLSPIYNVLFDYFYPVSIVLHLIGQGDIFDGLLNNWLTTTSFERLDIKAPLWFAVSYVVFAAASIRYKAAFWLLNALGILFFTVSAYYYLST